MSATDYMGWLHRGEEWARGFRQFIEDEDVSEEQRERGRMFANYVESHARELEADLTEELLAEEEA